MIMMMMMMSELYRGHTIRLSAATDQMIGTSLHLFLLGAVGLYTTCPTKSRPTPSNTMQQVINKRNATKFG